MIDDRPYAPDNVLDSVLFFGDFKTFTIEQAEDRCFIFGKTKSKGRRMWNYDVKDRLDKKFATNLGNEKPLDAPCFDSAGASRMRVCAIAPSEILIWRDRKYTITTGYSAFNGDRLIFLEKLR